LLFYRVQIRLHSTLLKYAEGQHCPQLNKIENVENSEKFRRFIVNLDMADHLLTFWHRNYFFLILAHPVYKM